MRPPGRIRLAFTGGVGGAANHRPIRVEEIDAAGGSVGAVGQEAVTRLGEEALESLDLEFELGAFKDVAGAVDAHLAAGLGQVVGLVVVDALGLDHHVGAAQHGVSFDLHVQLGASADAVAPHEGRQLGAFGRRQLLRQAHTASQRHRRRRIGGRRLLGLRRQRGQAQGQQRDGAQGKVTKAGPQRVRMHGCVGAIRSDRAGGRGGVCRINYP